MKKYLVTERFMLHVGYSCNVRCEFCYYQDNLKKGKIKDWTTEEIKRRIDFAVKLGKKAIDISGGEPTLREDLAELIAYCKNKNFKTINIITNGVRGHDYNYCKSLVEAGLTDVIISLHSNREDIHDRLTNVQGSYQKAIKTINNFKELGIKVSINQVVNNLNYQYLNEFLEMINDFNPVTVNLIAFTTSETAGRVSSESPIHIRDYNIIGNALSDALDNWKDRFNFINVLFLPFCFLKKHPECVGTQWQKFHADTEFDPVLMVWLKKGAIPTILATIAGLFMQHNSPKFKPANFQTFLCKCLSAFRMKYNYRQNDKCRKCSLSPICTGLQKNYVKMFGFPELEPIILDKKIYDPLYFIREKKSYHQMYKSLRIEDN